MICGFIKTYYARIMNISINVKLTGFQTITI